MDHVIYRLDNGEIVRSFSGPGDDVLHQLSVGEAAADGAGSWTTHRVVDGMLVALDQARVPPFDGAWWDAAEARWFDPFLDRESSVLATADLRAGLVRKMADLEARQLRPMREIELARGQGHQVPQAALQALHGIEAQVSVLRARIQALVP